MVVDDEPMKEEEKKIEEKPVGLSHDLISRFEALNEKLISERK